MSDIKKILELRSKPPRTARELADYLAVPYKTAWGWWAGRGLPKDESVRRRLLALTQAEQPTTGDTLPFEPIGGSSAPEPGMPWRDVVAQLKEVRALAAELNARLVLLAEEVKTNNIPEQQTDALLTQFITQLYDIGATLAEVSSDNERRNAFRRRVRKEDVAYVTTLLGSLLDEQKFTLWKAFQSFPMKEAKHK